MFDKALIQVSWIFKEANIEEAPIVNAKTSVMTKTKGQLQLIQRPIFLLDIIRLLLGRETQEAQKEIAITPG